MTWVINKKGEDPTTERLKFLKLEDLILFEDDDLLIVNKPPFVSTLNEREGTAISMQKLAHAHNHSLQICHRLDKETSGVLVMAKHPSAYRMVAMQFERRQIKKTYHAVVHGLFSFQNLLVDLPILNLGNKQVGIDRHRGKPAVTYFQSIQFFRHYTLVECEPITGRMHQIRIHLATQGAAIAGDKLYGGKPVLLSEMKHSYRLGKYQEEHPIMKRLALHAQSILLKTKDESEMKFEAPYPKDFAILLKLLKQYDS